MMRRKFPLMTTDPASAGFVLAGRSRRIPAPSRGRDGAGAKDAQKVSPTICSLLAQSARALSGSTA